MNEIDQVRKSRRKHVDYSEDEAEAAASLAEANAVREQLLDVVVTPRVQLDVINSRCGSETNCQYIAETQGVDTLVNKIVFMGYPPFQKFIVIRVRHDMTVQSALPNSKVHSSFEEYMFARHGLRYNYRDSPLLEVS